MIIYQKLRSMLQSVSKKKLENLHLRTIPILEKHGTVFLNQRILSFHYKDLVICEGGEPGRCAVWETDDRIFFQKALRKVRFTDDSTPKFYMYYLWYAAQVGQLNSLFTGTGIKHLTGQSLVKIQVPTADRSTQEHVINEIESRLSVCDSIEQTVDTALQQEEAMRQSILKQAFEGRL